MLRFLAPNYSIQINYKAVSLCLIRVNSIVLIFLFFGSFSGHSEFYRLHSHDYDSQIQNFNILRLIHATAFLSHFNKKLTSINSFRIKSSDVC